MNFLKKIINFMFYIFSIKENKIVFESGRGKIDENPYAIYKYIKDNNIKDFNLKILTNRGADISNVDKNDVCYYKTLPSLFHLATAKYWIRSQSLGSIITKRKGQIYIQMWHGSGGCKKMGNDINKYHGVVEHAKDWDFLITTDKLMEKVMCSSTGISKKITRMYGHAVTDKIVNCKKDDIKKIRDILNVPNNKSIILYAPTFRDYEMDKKTLELKINSLANMNEYIILVRMHPLISDKIDKLNLPDNFINVSKYPDIIDLELISDMLITDYSGVFFGYALLKKPIIFYPYDFNKYDKNRGFYYNYKEFVPGPVVYKDNELKELLINKDIWITKYQEKINDFNKEYNNLNDGMVSKRFVDDLKNKKFNKEG